MVRMVRSLGNRIFQLWSSRSHAVFIIRVFRNEQDRRTNATLYIVDLAGSERVLKTGASGQRLEEAKSRARWERLPAGRVQILEG